MEFKIPKELKGQELTNFLVNKRQELTDNVCQDPEELEKFVRMWNTNGLRNYSFNNIVLAFFQYPEMQMLAGFKKWKTLGRTVKKGEKAIRIVAPKVRKFKNDEDEEEYRITGWMYVNVFDIGQTEGKDIDFGHTDMVQGEADFKVISKISKLPVKVEYHGTSNGYCNKRGIGVAPKENEASMVATFLHEEAHNRLGHIGNKDISVEASEVEAETVAYIVCGYLGLENEKSQYYVGHWNGEGQELKGRGKNILTVAEGMIKDINALA